MREKIATIQVSLSLLRDLILTMIALLTVMILYFGGNPKELTPLDWAELVIRSFGLVVAPIFAYFVVKYAYWGLGKIVNPYLYLYGDDVKVPRGPYLYLSEKWLSINNRKYIKGWSRIKKRFSTFKGRNVLIDSCLRGIRRFVIDIEVVFERQYSWFMAVIIFIFSVSLFVQSVNQYVPRSLQDIAIENLCSNKNFNADWLLGCAEQPAG